MFQHPSQPKAPQARVGVDENPANVTTLQFVQGSFPPNQGPKGPPKLNHKKSRNGCRQCKTRRVKVTSPISFIFHSRWFGSSRLEGFFFPQVCEIINSCIVPFLPDLVFHLPSTSISEYCRRPNLQLTQVLVNSVMKP